MRKGEGPGGRVWTDWNWTGAEAAGATGRADVIRPVLGAGCSRLFQDKKLLWRIRSSPWGVRATLRASHTALTQCPANGSKKRSRSETLQPGGEVVG